MRWRGRLSGGGRRIPLPVLRALGRLVLGFARICFRLLLAAVVLSAPWPTAAGGIGGAGEALVGGGSNRLAPWRSVVDSASRRTVTSVARSRSLAPERFVLVRVSDATVFARPVNC